MQKILLLDLDGTIRAPLSGARFVEHPRDQKIIEGADRAISYYHERGWVAIGISNQGGVAAGYKSLEDAILEQQYTLELFPELQAVYLCPDFEGKRCIAVGRKWVQHFLAATDADRLKWRLDPDLWKQRPPGVIIGGLENDFSFRKPGPGMLLKAVEDLSEMRSASFLELVDKRLANCWYVGDRLEDEQAAENAGILFMHAETWLNRFRPGVHTFDNLSRRQIEFLEGIAFTN